jgi:cation transporter-like permease
MTAAHEAPGPLTTVSLVGRERLVGSRLVEDRARTFLARMFALAFAGTIAGGFIGAFSPHWAEVKELLQVILPAETGLLGSALGFYFGSHQNKD